MKTHPICPASISWTLDNPIRKLIQNPNKILSHYIKKGMVVLEIGPGSGLYTRELAKLVGEKGKIIAADIQAKMLKKLKKKIKGKDIEKRIKVVKTNENNINVKEKVDFVFAMYVVHEVKNPENLLKQAKGLMKKNAKLLLVEPSIEVSEKAFKETIRLAKKAGFKKPEKGPKVFWSRSILLNV